MKFNLFSNVVIGRDLPAYHLRQGDVGVVVEYVENPGKEDGYILELFDSQGKTIDVVPVLESWLELPKANTILTYRELDKAA
jgi:hypothetical protein